MKLDVLIAHPLKHHVFHLAAGIAKSGLRYQLIVPLYRKGIGRIVANLPGAIGRKASGYFYEDLATAAISSPAIWQLKRLLASSSRINKFQTDFDSFVASKILNGNILPRILVTMQDYMPKTMAAAADKGIIIWSDQILNSSPATRSRVANHLKAFNLDDVSETSEADNDNILSRANIITAPSFYVLEGIRARVNNAGIYRVPYGVDNKKFFSREKKFDGDRIRVLVRANSVRKGGPLFSDALQAAAPALLSIAGRAIEFKVIGSLDAVTEEKFLNISLPVGVSLVPVVVPHLDMPDLISESDLFIMPSLSEGMSLICIEALQCAVPIIITPYCGIDILKEFPAGIEVNADVESIRDGLIYAFNHIQFWGKWSEAAKQAAEQMSWEIYEMAIAEIAKNAIL